MGNNRRRLVHRSCIRDIDNIGRYRELHNGNTYL